MKVLFICKKNEIYGSQLGVYSRRSSGLFNSTSFIVRALREKNIWADIIEVQDNNDIDRQVRKHNPDVVVIEALWVVPEKFPVLQRLHPQVQWCVHLHSDMPFLAIEGIAMDWIIRSAALGVQILANSEESFDALGPIVPEARLSYLPNVYLGEMQRPVSRDKSVVDVGCFGAVRPLKNHLLQALASIQFAREIGKPLRFHINTGRVETGGEPVLKNLRQLFEDMPNAKLVENRWYDPKDFLYHLHHNIDIGMQVSLTETFNVVTADYVTAGLPIVVSKEVKWASDFSKATDNSLPDIVAKMHRAWGNHMLVRWNQLLLKRSAAQAACLWAEFIESL